MGKSFRTTIIVLILFLPVLAGCQSTMDQSPKPSASAVLPLPIAHTVENPRLPEETSIPTEMAAPQRLPDNLEEMAESVYGPRLIDWVELSSIQVRAPVRPVGWDAELEDGVPEWDNPEAEVGWVVSSALPGDEANIVLYGHNNIHSSVFKRLADLERGDTVILQTRERKWRYIIDGVEIVAVSGSEQDTLAYQQVLQPAAEARLTLLSCWPPDNNTHRVIVTAYPESDEPKP